MHKDLNENIHELTNHLFRENYGKVVAHLSQKYGYNEIECISDAVQESFEAALSTWKFSGIPTNQLAWIYKVANNKLINKIRQSNQSKQYVNSLEINSDECEALDERELENSLLKLLIFFSKIELSDRNKLIISLHFLCAFGYAELANAFILKIETIKKIILRSKETIKQFTKKYDNFQIGSFDEHLPHLQKIIYLMFNEGYKASAKNRNINNELCYEAIRLAKLVQSYHEKNVSINALLALMFFNSSRFPARIENNHWVSLEDQDRVLWNKDLMSAGFFYLKRIAYNPINLDSYYLEALISSIHCTSESYAKTNWKTIALLYRQLEKINPKSFSIKLNRIISESNFRHIKDLIDELNLMKTLIPKEVAFTFYSTIAHLHNKLQDWELAIENYNQSLNYTKNKTDISYVNLKINQIRNRKENSSKELYA